MWKDGEASRQAYLFVNMYSGVYMNILLNLKIKLYYILFSNSCIKSGMIGLYIDNRTEHREKKYIKIRVWGLFNKYVSLSKK